MNKVTGLVILAIVLLVIAVDIVLATFYGSDGTISWWLWTESHNWPAIPFAFGVLMGHFFFSQPHLPPKE